MKPISIGIGGAPLYLGVGLYMYRGNPTYTWVWGLKYKENGLILHNIGPKWPNLREYSGILLKTKYLNLKEIKFKIRNKDFFLQRNFTQ